MAGEGVDRLLVGEVVKGLPTTKVMHYHLHFMALYSTSVRQRASLPHLLVIAPTVDESPGVVELQAEYVRVVLRGHLCRNIVTDVV